MFKVGEISAAWARQSKMQVFFEASSPSTNDWAKEKAFGPELSSSPISVFFTDNQTRGRGRGENTWSQASAGSALMSSWVFALSRAPRPVVTCRIGMAVERALYSTWPWLQLSLKAPNDLYIGADKLGGILVENLQQGSSACMIVGLGLNIFTKPELPQTTSLLEHLKNENLITAADWHVFLDRLFLELSLAISLSADALSATEQKALLHSLNKKADLTEKYISVEGDGTLVTASRRIHWSEL